MAPILASIVDWAPASKEQAVKKRALCDGTETDEDA